MIRFIASIASALFLSFIFTIISDKQLEGVLYYSFASKFLNGFLILLIFHLLLAVPISIILDYKIRKFSRIIQVLLYFLVGVAIGLTFLVINPTNNFKAGLELTLLFGLAGCTFALFLNLFRYIKTKIKTQILKDK